MPSLYERVGARGYASGVVAGETGEASLQATQAVRRPDHTGIDFRRSSTTLIGFDPEGPPPPDYEIIEGAMGLPGELLDPLTSPGYGPGYTRTHAAPMPGWAGSYGDAEALETLHENSREIHSADFGMPDHLRRVDDVPRLPVDHWSANDPGGHTNQAPLTGPQRSMGYLSKDAIQGYDRRNRYGFDAGHRWRDSTPGYQDKTGGQPLIYIDPAERPFIVPQAQGSFVPDDAVQGPEPWVSDLHAANVNYTDPSAYATPPEPATLRTPLTEALPSAGWGDG